MKFIDEIAAHLKEINRNLEDCVIVLPSGRMRKYLQKAIANSLDKPVLAPKITTIDQWIKEQVNEQILDRTRQLLLLYSIHVEIEKDPIKATFEEFISWGEMLLSDFDDIDRYLVDHKLLFRNLADIKEIENWSFDSTSLSEGQKRFMEFWDTLPIYYERFEEELKKRKQSTSAKAYRKLAQSIDLIFEKKKETYVVFAGFNALSQAEKSIIKQLQQMGRASVLFDMDRFYMDKNHHEAGSFIRANLKEVKSELAAKDILSNKKMHIQAIACSQHTGQVKIVADKLADIAKNNPAELSETLILLADESLITVLVKNLPKEIGRANISMGIPLRSTAIRPLMDILYSIQSNFERFNTDGYYYVELVRLFKHPFIQTVVSIEELERLQKLEADIIRRNRIFISHQGLLSAKVALKEGDLVIQILTKIRSSWKNNASLMIQCLKEIASMLYERIPSESAIDRASLEAFYKSALKFEAIGLNELPEMSLRTQRQFFERHWMNESIAYHGNPIDGLQITGLLESRGLDFKRVFAVGLNEGKLPPTNPIQTLIPMDLRRYFSLPMPRDKQGLFAHHFYRLLHACDELVITYSTLETEGSHYEASRYLLQIEKELSRSNRNIDFQQLTYVLHDESELATNSIQKTPDILRRLDELFAQSLSASALRSYLYCPLDFYYKYVLAFGEVQEVEEELEASSFGTIIHETLEQLYLPYSRLVAEKVDGETIWKEQQIVPVTSLVIDKMLKEYPLVLESAFRKQFNEDSEAFKTGSNYLAFEMANTLIERFLKNERGFVMRLKEPLYIEALEYKMELDRELLVNGEMKRVHFKGIADRIDRIGEQYRIIDYKSGKVANADHTYSSRVGDMKENLEKRKFLIQLTQYIWMYKELTGKDATAGIYSFLNKEGEFHEIDFKEFDREELIAAFPDLIGTLLESIYDEELPFEHTYRSNSFCNYCA